jgi:hypothetical protein
MEGEDIVFIENVSSTLIASSREPSNEPYRSEATIRSNANRTPPSTFRGPLPSVESPKDVAALPGSQGAMNVSKNPTEALFGRCQPGESTEHEVEMVDSFNKMGFPYISGPPVQTKPGLPGLEKNCPPLASPVSHI